MNIAGRLKQERELRADARAFARLFETDDGRRVMDVIERELGWCEPSSVGTEAGVGVDVHATMVRDGQKVAVKFIHDMRAAGARVARKDEAGDGTEYEPGK